MQIDRVRAQAVSVQFDTHIKQDVRTFVCDFIRVGRSVVLNATNAAEWLKCATISERRCS